MNNSVIGVIGAMQLEVEALRAAMTDVRTESVSGVLFSEGILDGQPVVCAVCGVGKVFAAICTQTMILRYHPALIVNTGVGGTLTDRAGIGDLVVASHVVQHDMDTSPLGDPVGLLSGINVVRIACDPAASAELSAIAEKEGLRTVSGTVATGDQFVGDPAEKSRIVGQFGAVACEMEGGAVGQVCYVNGTPFCVLRAISDEADGTSPADFGAFAREAAAHSLAVLRAYLKTRLKKN